MSDTKLKLNKDPQHSPVVPVAMQRVDIQLGISTKKPPAPADIEAQLVRDFGDASPCSCCGIITTAAGRKTLACDSRWHSVCQLCFYTENLDLIPMFEKGTILYQPFLSQAQIFTLMRARIAHALMVGVIRDPSPDLQDELADNDQTIGSLIEKLSRNSGGSNAANADTVDSYIHLMDLLRPEDYDNRFMLLTDYRWIPDVKMMGLDAKNIKNLQFDVFHPEKSDSFIKGFVLKYGLPFEID